MSEKNIAILGAGISGQAAAKLCRRHGLAYRLIGDDREALPPDFNRSDLFVVSPGLPPESPLYRAAVAAGTEMVSEIEFASRFTRNKIVAVTGTNGKTTTTELTVAILQGAGVTAQAAGNIGTALSEAVITAAPDAVLVVEVSSFQLELCRRFRPVAGVVLNIASDHLERYSGSMARYLQTKLRLWDNISSPEYRLAGAELVRSQYFPTGTACKVVEPLPLNTPALPPALSAPHNRANLAAAIALSHAIIPEEQLPIAKIMRILSDFAPGAHRLEPFLESRGIRCIDDSKATNPAAVVAAVNSLAAADSGHIRIILGGLDKGMDFSELRPIVPRLRKAYIYGAGRDAIAAALPLEAPCFAEFDAAVTAACREAQPGDIILLSPACASMDQFRDYRQRGEYFQTLARQLLETT